MLQLLVAGGSFNEAGYLRENPDVAEAVEAGQIRTARLHYIGFGFFEGRSGATPDVDEAWYRRRRIQTLTKRSEAGSPIRPLSTSSRRAQRKAEAPMLEQSMPHIGGRAAFGRALEPLEDEDT